MTRGRPREFDPGSALDAALAVFARVGYEQASVQDLAACMGICKPSLYAAYGNKEALFIEAIRRYAAQGAAHQQALLDAHRTAREAIGAVLDDKVQAYTSGAESPGCLIIAEAASAQAAYSDAVRAAIAEVLTGGGAQVHERIARGVREGDVPPDTDTAALSSYVLTVMAGLSVQARNGATGDELRAVVRTALMAWPAMPMRHSPPVPRGSARVA